MKSLFTLCLGILSFSLFSQNCQNPVSAPVYQNNFNKIAMMRTDPAKLEGANAFLASNCVLSSQVKNIAMLFSTDSFRILFCREAYFHTNDVSNFYHVYDAFTSFSSALRLYDYVSKVPVTTLTTNPNVITTAPVGPVFPLYIYPGTDCQTSNRGCPGPVVTDAVFKAISENVFKQPTDESRLVAIETASNGNCLSMAQMMKLTSLITSEDLRMRVLKSTFPRVYDQEHYPSAAILFAGRPNQDLWNAYAKAYLTPPPAPCLVKDNDFNVLLQQIKDKRFTDEKLNAVTLMSKDRCFNTTQLKAIAKEFPFGDEKLKVFKMFYAKCPDQNNYYQLVDELAFSSEKENLSNFIKNGGK